MSKEKTSGWLSATDSATDHVDGLFDNHDPLGGGSAAFIEATVRGSVGATLEVFSAAPGKSVADSGQDGEECPYTIHDAYLGLVRFESYEEEHRIDLLRGLAISLSTGKSEEELRLLYRDTLLPLIGWLPYDLGDRADEVIKKVLTAIAGSDRWLYASV